MAQEMLEPWDLAGEGASEKCSWEVFVAAYAHAEVHRMGPMGLWTCQDLEEGTSCAQEGHSFPEEVACLKELSSFAEGKNLDLAVAVADLQKYAGLVLVVVVVSVVHFLGVAVEAKPQLVDLE